MIHLLATDSVAALCGSPEAPILAYDVSVVTCTECLAEVDKRPSSEWVAVLNVTILDPDGWDRTNFSESWAEPITRDEFLARARRSTSDLGSLS